MVALDRHQQITREERLLTQVAHARNLVRRLGHEIKNPLGGLRGAAQLLQSELPDAALREYTKVIIREADRLTTLVDRMIGPRRPPRMEPVNIHEVTERVRALVNAETPASIVVERDYDPSIPDVVADPELLIQAMLNIARNAVHALGEGGRIMLRTRVQRRVSIGARQHRLMCRIDVADDGPGIPDDLVDSMFYPLVSGRDGGAGLGLSIAQSLVYEHGGIIECASAPGGHDVQHPAADGHRGSRPGHVSGAGEVGRARASGPGEVWGDRRRPVDPVGAGARARPRRVHGRGDSTAVGACMRACGSTSPTRSSPTSACPTWDGLDLLGEITARYPHLPVVIMTGYSDLDSAVSAYRGRSVRIPPEAVRH